MKHLNQQSYGKRPFSGMAVISWRALPVMAVLALGGCSLPSPQADSVRYFTLSGPATDSPTADPVLVRPVRLSGHLRNRAMAIRVSEHEVIYLEDVRWGEPLDEAITQILRNRLRQVSGGATVLVQVQRCELNRGAGNSVEFAATFSVTPANGEQQSGFFTAKPKSWDGRDYDLLVGQIRSAVDEFAETIAQSAVIK